jgi:hypothetical protein
LCLCAEFGQVPTFLGCLCQSIVVIGYNHRAAVGGDRTDADRVIGEARERQSEGPTGFDEIGVSKVLCIVKDEVIARKVASIEFEQVLVAITNENGRICSVTIIGDIVKGTTDKINLK